jgi:CoA transferase family III
VHVTFGAVRGPQEVIADPQLRLNDIVVPLEGAGGKLTSTVSSPIQVHGVTKVPAKRAPALGEHNQEILAQLGFDINNINADLWSLRVRGDRRRPTSLRAIRKDYIEPAVMGDPTPRSDAQPTNRG